MRRPTRWGWALVLASALLPASDPTRAASPSIAESAADGAASQTAPAINGASRVPTAHSIAGLYSRTSRAAREVVDWADLAVPLASVEGPTLDADLLLAVAAPDAQAAAAPVQTGGAAKSKARERRRPLHGFAAQAASSLVDDAAPRSSTSPHRYLPSFSPALFGEALDSADEAVRIIPGFRLENVTLGVGFSSNGLPLSNLAARRGGIDLGGDQDVTGSATFSFRKAGRYSSFEARYTPTHIARRNLSAWNTTNHVLSLSTSRDIGRRWTVSATAGGADSGFEQFFFTLPVLRAPDFPASSLDDVLDALGNGAISEDEAASLLTGSPVVDAPGETNLDLSRTMRWTAGASANFRYSRRLTFTFSGGLSGQNVRSLPNVENRDTGGLIRFTSSRTRTASAGLTYDLTRRSSFSVQQSESRFSSELQEGNISRTTGSYSFGFGRWWRARAHLGIGSGRNFQTFDTALGSVAGRNDRSTNNLLFGGELGYQRRTVGWIVAAQRDVGDRFGIGSTRVHSLSAQATWRPGAVSPWSLDGGGGWSRTDFDLIESLRGRRFNTRFAQIGLTRAVSRTTAVRTEYLYGRSSSPLTGLFSDVEIHRAQVSFIWRPAEAR